MLGGIVTTASGLPRKGVEVKTSRMWKGRDMVGVVDWSGFSDVGVVGVGCCFIPRSSHYCCYVSFALAYRGKDYYSSLKTTFVHLLTLLSFLIDQIDVLESEVNCQFLLDFVAAS